MTTAFGDRRLPSTTWRHWQVPLMIAVAFLLRLAVILYCRTYLPLTAASLPSRFGPPQHHFMFGFETGAIAGSIASGHGFASPFEGNTGYTAWISPIYPYLCALVFKICGLYSTASAITILALNSLFSALTCPFIVRLGEKTVGRRAGLAAGWMWAAGFFFMRWPTTWVWDMALSALLLTIALNEAVSLPQTTAAGKWIRFGLVWGIIALSNPSMLTVLALSGLWLVYKFRQEIPALIRPASLALLTFVLTISPWIVRNRLVFGEWVFLRGNSGFELSLGNYATSNGFGWFGRHPTQNAREFEKYRTMGEVRYVRSKKEEALSFIRTQPKAFLSLSAKRFYDFWYGTILDYMPRSLEMWRPWMYWPLSLMTALGAWLAIRNRVPQSGFLFLAVIFYPTAYYFIYSGARYRHAIEPVMLLLTAYLLLWPARMLERHRQRRAEEEPVTELEMSSV